MVWLHIVLDVQQLKPHGVVPVGQKQAPVVGSQSPFVAQQLTPAQLCVPVGQVKQIGAPLASGTQI